MSARKFLPLRLRLAILALVLCSPVAAQSPDWTVFAVAPCELADVRPDDQRELRFDLRRTSIRAHAAARRAEASRCRIPDHAEGVLVDVLIDANSDTRIALNRNVSLAARKGFTAQRAALALCASQRCKSDVAFTKLSDVARVRVFVRGYLMRGQRNASVDLIATMVERDRQRVRDCQVLMGPNGELTRIGPDCGLDYSGVPVGNVDEPDDPVHADPSTPPSGCPYDYFPQNEWFAQDTRFRFPVEPREWIVPTAIHMDHDRNEGANHIDCDPWFPGLLCYDNHEGTDFSLIGGFWKQDDRSVYAVAAADGVVMSTRSNRFDRCEADLAPFDCSTQQCETVFGVRVCSPCGPNPDFGQPFCQDGDEPRDYDGLSANFVRLCHADGAISRYLHLMKDSVLVSEGDTVACGDQLGLIGSSGRSAGPHLHFDVKQDGQSGWIDPYDAGAGESMWVAPSLPGLLPGPECQ